MKQTTMQLHQISTNGIDCWHIVPAYLVPGTSTWYVVKAEDETRATRCDTYSRSDAFGLFHDGLVAARFIRRRDAIDAGMQAATIWDRPGLPDAGSLERVALTSALRLAPGRWWMKR